MFDRDLKIVAFDHKNPLINIVDQVSNVDKSIEHLDEISIPIVHFLVYDLNDLYKHVRLSRDRIPIDQHHVDLLLEHE